MASDIIYIDDEPQQLIAAARIAKARPRFAEYELPHLDGAAAAAARANLWVFDFFNDETQRLSAEIGNTPSNGLSVFQQFRLLIGEARPPAIVVSNHLEEALGVHVSAGRRHIIAEQVGVEWVAHKVQGDGSAVPQILALADAVAKLRTVSTELSAASPLDYVAELAWSALGLPKNVDWARRAVGDIAAWRPPAWIENPQDQRTAVLRDHLPGEADLRSARDMVAWLLRQVLPYPSFIVRDRHIAVAMGLSLNCVRDAIGADTALAKNLRKMIYKGVLAEFDGPRWWAAGIDALAWGLPRSKEDRSKALKKLLVPIEVEELTFIDPVVVSDSELVETDEIAPAAVCVRATDDHFPPHAEPAWVKIEDASRDRVLARWVKLEDQTDLVPQN